MKEDDERSLPIDREQNFTTIEREIQSERWGGGGDGVCVFILVF